MNPIIGGFVLFMVTSPGSYEQVEQFQDKTRYDTRAWQETLKLRKNFKIDTGGYYVDKGMPAFIRIRQKGIPPKKEKGILQ
jgi:hypothetical protein